MNKKMNSHVRSKCSSNSFFIVFFSSFTFRTTLCKIDHIQKDILSSVTLPRALYKVKTLLLFFIIVCYNYFVKYLLSILDYIMFVLHL